MNEFGEYPSIYVSPIGHEEGESFGDDFWDRVTTGLKSVGIEWESV